jgi:hypothetical protein
MPYSSLYMMVRSIILILADIAPSASVARQKNGQADTEDPRGLSVR